MRTAASALALVLVGLASFFLWNSSVETADEALAGVVISGESSPETREVNDRSASTAGSATPAVSPKEAEQASSALTAQLTSLYVVLEKEVVLPSEGSSVATPEPETATDPQKKTAAETKTTTKAAPKAERKSTSVPRSKAAPSGGSSAPAIDSRPKPVSPPPVQLDADDLDDDADDEGDDDAEDGGDDARDDDEGDDAGEQSDD